MIRDKLPINWIHIYDSLRFEVKTSLGRTFQKKLTLLKSDYLHVGCGDSLLDGFLNTDAFTNNKADYRIDLRFPLPFENSSFQGIYAHHVVEHLTYENARFFFQEAKRILKNGGTLRIVVPDAEKFIKKYIQSSHDPNFPASLIPEWHRSPEWQTSLEVLDHVFRDNYFNQHLSAWDFYTLNHRLKETGFKEIRQVECGISNDQKLCNLDKEDWQDQSVYVEAKV
ncbi:MAG: methyltransferase domain-containing protein [Nostocales cyanobacterium]|nr:MAG: methyltransferase domain-containing protein [Nostocales cyanobacterium]